MKKIIVRSVIFIVIFLMITLSGDFFMFSKLSSYDNKQTDVWVIAHRGNSSEAPENTLIAIESALDVGADVIEIDVRMTKDSVVVLMHDANVERTTNGSGIIAEMTFEEVQSLDAGRWFDNKFRAEPIPTLAEVIDLIEGEALLLIEVKVANRGIEEEVVKIIKEKKAEAWCWVQSFQNQAIETVQDLAPEIKTAQLVYGNITFLPFHLNPMMPRLGRIHEYEKVAAVNPNYRLISKKTIDNIHTRGYKVFVWTVDDENNIKKLIDMGVDGIITNKPREAYQLIHQSK